MEPKEWCYWIEGENEGQKQYFTDSEKFLLFLQNNDPCECGADELLLSTIKKLDALGDDEMLPPEELL